MRITTRGLTRLIERAIREQEEIANAFSCPAATEDIRLNTENRNVAIQDDLVRYGPMNLSDESYWEELAEFWNTKAKVAKKSRCGNCGAFDISPQMQECMPGEIRVPEGEDERMSTLGYCWMYDFKCHSARSCRTWVAGGPITDDETSSSWHRKKSRD
jgi:hypothetical protein